MLDVLFITPTPVLSVKQEVNGTMLLATKLLQDGFSVDILRFAQIKGFDKDYHLFIEEITTEILRREPRCVSFYSLWLHYHIILRIVQNLKAKAPWLPIVLGGPQASVCAEPTLKGFPSVDYVLTGEGEHTVVPFFRSLLCENGTKIDTIPGLFYRNNGEIKANAMDIPLCDLNELPHWDDRLYLSEYTDWEESLPPRHYAMPLDVGRGCPFNCTFCCTNNFWHRTYRLKSPAKIIEEIQYYNKKFGYESFLFSHDAFTANKQLVEELCDHIIDQKLDVSWICSTRADCLTEDLIAKMKKAGMFAIQIGVETGSPRMQKLTRKNLKLDKVKEIVDALLKNNIHITLFFMYGFPEETEQELNETMEYMFDLVDAGVKHANMAYCLFLPGTDMTVRHFNDLVLDPSIKILTLRHFGVGEEWQMIENHKELFSVYYHLNTPLRNKYQYVRFLAQIYEQFPHSARYIRRLYKGDNLNFYKDFYNNNLEIFEKSIEHIVDFFNEKPLEGAYNTIKNLDFPYIPQLKALMEYEYDYRRVLKSKENIEVRKTYDFIYLDLARKRPIESYSVGKTELLIRKENNKKMLIKVLDMQ